MDNETRRLLEQMRAELAQQNRTIAELRHRLATLPVRWGGGGNVASQGDSVGTHHGQVHRMGTDNVANWGPVEFVAPVGVS